LTVAVLDATDADTLDNVISPATHPAVDDVIPPRLFQLPLYAFNVEVAATTFREDDAL
jgi:hypothetical protein